MIVNQRNYFTLLKKMEGMLIAIAMKKHLSIIQAKKLQAKRKITLILAYVGEIMRC